LRRYLGGSGGGVRAAYWRLSRDRASIVVRAQIPWSRKVVMLAQLARLMRFHWRRLAWEAGQLARRSP
jgi:hypothetical protein